MQVWSRGHMCVQLIKLGASDNVGRKLHLQKQVMNLSYVKITWKAEQKRTDDSDLIA